VTIDPSLTVADALEGLIEIGLLHLHLLSVLAEKQGYWYSDHAICIGQVHAYVQNYSCLHTYRTYHVCMSYCAE
jgi:hypothetical protein